MVVRDGGPTVSRDWEVIGYVISSTYRQTVLATLHESPATPSTISDETGIAMAHVSAALTDLRERDLVQLLVPESRRKGRVYGLTDRGEEVVSVIREENL